MSVRVVTLAELLKSDAPCLLLEEVEGIVSEACSVQGVFEREVRRRFCRNLPNTGCVERSRVNANLPVEFLVEVFNETENIECECGETERAYISKIVMENNRYRKLKSKKVLDNFKKILMSTFSLSVDDIMLPNVRVLKRTNPVGGGLEFTSFVLPLYGHNLVIYRDVNKIEDLIDFMIGLRGGYMVPSPRRGTYYPLGVVTYSSLLCSSLTLLDELERGKLINSRLDVWSKMKIRSCLKCMIKKRYNALYRDILNIDEKYEGFKKLVFYLCAEFVRVAQPNAWERRSFRRP